MKGFKTLPIRTVTLTRQDEEGKDVKLEFKLQPLPLGYVEYLALVYPPKAREFVNGKPELTDPERQQHGTLTSYLLIARSLRDADPSQIDTKEPGANATWAEWHAAALAVQAEFEAAHLVSGDLNALLKGLNLVNQGAGRPKKDGAGV
jgi:hypothetical protein